MQLSFNGKGGSGKTTLASLFVRRSASLGQTVMAVDADVNQNLAGALGIDTNTQPTVPILGNYMRDIAEYLRGSNPLIPSAKHMLKTTPPGPGSRLLTLTENNELYSKILATVPVAGVQPGDTHKIRFAATGDFEDDDIGVSCYHSKTGASELLSSHIIHDKDAMLVFDMTAGVDTFASGFFAHPDCVVVVVEPTLRSIGVYRQFMKHAKGYDMNVVVFGNKIKDESDLAFLHQEVGEDNVVAYFGISKYLATIDKGYVGPLSEFEAENLAALDQLIAYVMKYERDWRRFTQLLHEFHRRNAMKWGNDRTGVDLTQQIVPDYILGKHLLDK